MRRKKEGLALTDVNCGLGVDVVRVRLVLVGRPHALVIVLVAVHEKVNALVKEQLLQPAAAGAAFAHRSGGRVAVAVAGAVDAAVAVHDDPRLLVAVAVGFGQVSLQERELLRAGVGGANAEVDLG